MLKEKLYNLNNMGHSLIRQGRTELGIRLLKFCEDPTKPDFPIWCAQNGVAEMFEIFAKSGFDLSVNYGKSDCKQDRVTLETIAMQYGHENLSKHIKKLTFAQIKLSQHLLNRAKDGTFTTQKRKLHCGSVAEFKGIKQLIDEGAVIDWRGFEKTTALMFACQYGYVEIVKYLIEAGADVNATDFMGVTPLMWASCSNNIKILKLLIDAGADVNARDRQNGSTALIWWATNSEDNVEAIELLIKNNAKVFRSIVVQMALKHKLLDKDRTALDHARTKGNEKIVRFLEEYGKTALAKLKEKHSNSVEEYSAYDIYQ